MLAQVGMSVPANVAEPLDQVVAGIDGPTLLLQRPAARTGLEPPGPEILRRGPLLATDDCDQVAVSGKRRVQAARSRRSSDRNRSARPGHTLSPQRGADAV